LDNVPRAAWDMLPIDSYEIHKDLPEKNTRPTLPILATRGCPYTCTFCTSPNMWGTRYFMRTPTDVFDEMVSLNKRYSVINFEFYDLTAIINKKWIMELTQLMINHDVKLYWKIPSGTRSEALDSEVAKNLMASHCYTLAYAPESGSKRLLEAIHKKVNLERMIDSMKASKQEGLKLFINIILGIPGEKHKDVFATFSFLFKCGWIGVDEMHLSIFRPYPGTALFKQLIDEGKIQMENDDYFIDTILNIEQAESRFNSYVSSSWYKFYFPLALVVFYSARYVHNPLKLIRTFKNVINNNSQNRFERYLVVLLGKKPGYRLAPH
jgi:radical SAM superfamily enzyme YgiQ (UPF0313 family)